MFRLIISKITIQPIALRLEAIALRLEANATRVEAIALRVEAIALRVEAIAIKPKSGVCPIPLPATFDTRTVDYRMVIGLAFVQRFQLF